MTPYSKDYIVPGDIFADENVLCIRCGIKIIGLSYKEVPKINSPQETVKLAHKIRLGNHRQVGVVLYRKGRESMTYLPVCKDCVKEVVPERDTDEIIKQIKRAQQIEARWAGLPEEVIEGISRQFADARIVRKLSTEELLEGKILEAV